MHSQTESDDSDFQDTIEAEFFSDRRKIYPPDFYIWKPLNERISAFLWKTGKLIPQLAMGFAGYFVISGLWKVITTKKSVTMNGFEIVGLFLMLFFGFLLAIGIPSSLVGLARVLLKYRKDRRKYESDRQYWDSYHLQQRELAAFSSQKIAEFRNN